MEVFAMYRSLFPRDLFAEMDRLQREMQQAFDLSPSIRGLGRGGFPALNVGGTPQAIEIYAFAPGLDPTKIDIQLDRGLLTASAPRPCRPRRTRSPPCTSTSASRAASGAC
jgi:HSP20 family protein